MGICASSAQNAGSEYDDQYAGSLDDMTVRITVPDRSTGKEEDRVIPVAVREGG